MISIFELFSIGIGPSSSHTVGPMRAANTFVQSLQDNNLLGTASKIQIKLYGSLALTCEGHGTDKAVMIGLELLEPETVLPNIADERFNSICKEHKLNLAQQKIIPFDKEHDLILLKDKSLPLHANALTFFALDTKGNILQENTFYSIGGGFIATEKS